jgi:hypothetical protein
MKTLAGLTALAIVLIGSAVLAHAPGARHTAAGVELTESPTEDMPPYIHFDPNDWH